MINTLSAKIIAGLLLLGLALASPVQAADEVAIPTLQQRVTDLTHTLSPDQQAALESRLAQFEQEKGSQIAVLIVPTTQPEVIEQYALRVVEAWKLGRGKVDDGVLVLVAKDDRKMRIEVGYGLEGAVPDVIAKRIVSDVMAPAFRQGDFYAGINNAVDYLTRLISGEGLPAPPPRQGRQGAGGFGEMLPLLLFGGLVLGGVLRAMFGNFLGGSINAGLVGAAVMLFGGGILFAIVLAIVAFFITMMGGLGIPGGGFGGGSGWGGGGFSGGGGGFGGGGASGDW
ncbi:YgcG family protein [Methylobacillus gramineus]|uniref:TPM domain-containing protein n=1 Tax=Methylobacillus gramineus TaxID=755169 RepID=UPI001D000458|nr:YgcG family protein [Methylobacillus gramineus]MCB5185258.1 YgcG family protein [Methylobacillus gramineus]